MWGREWGSGEGSPGSEAAKAHMFADDDKDQIVNMHIFAICVRMPANVDDGMLKGQQNPTWRKELIWNQQGSTRGASFLKFSIALVFDTNNIFPSNTIIIGLTTH